ncbi:uncharacterized protein EV422DRAFT_212811 [Fimicolochytrium jonesii]|uniref:uncharacterized protein n=1 Tax=Fimicolochytrium jonesii TaxID=1396493 RepID=UPI0022FEC639|nr:uncharacterized protein EV422DRAFT_212811 [Fimicolochytrium jonesii]KAI8817701.1 hypothetical protein EV422DRAFT_212811 [Fimicolochytrium jonesii]
MAEIPQAVACYDRPVLAESRTNPRLPATLTRGDSFTAENLRCQPFKHGLQRFVPRCPSAKELRLHVIGDNQDDLALLHANYQTDVEREKIFVSQREDWLGRYANLNGVHRAVVVDWLAELAEDNWIHDSTYHLAVNYFDLYMSKSNMDHVLYDLQAIAISMIFFSAKKEVRQRFITPSQVQTFS